LKAFVELAHSAFQNSRECLAIFIFVNISSVTIWTRTPVRVCEERESLTSIYLDATEAYRKDSYSVKDIHAPQWLEVTKDTRRVCWAALAALKIHIREHEC
jgi:hypothetical protein